jgi:hypothetical protein
MSNPYGADGPSARELAAIEAEQPLIVAELEELTAVIEIISTDGPPDEMAVRRYRRAQQRVLREMCAFLALHDSAESGHAEVA